MWNMLFTLSLSGVLITAVTENNLVWFILFSIAMHICAAGIVITHEEQKEKIKNLEKKLEKLEGKDKC